MSNTLYEGRIKDGFTGISATVAGREYFAAGKVGGYVDVYLVVDGEKVFVDFGVWKDGAIRETGCGGVGVDANVLEVLTLRLAAAFSPVPPAAPRKACCNTKAFDQSRREADYSFPIDATAPFVPMESNRQAQYGVTKEGWSRAVPSSCAWIDSFSRRKLGLRPIETLEPLVDEVREMGLEDERGRKIGQRVFIETSFDPEHDATWYAVTVHATRDGKDYGSLNPTHYFETADAALECANTLVARSFKRYARTFGGAK